MKNKKIVFLILILSLFTFNSVYSDDDFTFESKKIDIENNGNLIIAEGNVKITSNNGMVIYSDNSEYNKINKELLIKGNAQIIDKMNKLDISASKFIYSKNLEKIQSVGKTLVKYKDKYIVETSDLNYSNIDNKIISNYQTIITDNFGYKAKTNSFIFDTEKNIIDVTDLEISDKQNNIYKVKNTRIDLNQEKILSKDPEIYLSDNSSQKNSRLKGRSMVMDESNTTVTKGIFTNCKPSDKCPPWSMESKKIVHDKEKKLIKYENAWLRLYDQKILYFPKFFHPDPTVKRQSGFLMPSIKNSKNSGSAFSIPYFKVLSENKDFTLTPRFFFNNDILVQNEYRQIEKNTKHITDFSFKKTDSSSKSHFFSNTIFDLDENNFDTSSIEINIQKVSNDTYLKNDGIKTSIKNNDGLMHSYMNMKASREDIDIFIEAASYEDLSKTKNSDKYQFILPNFRLSKLIFDDLDLKGELQFVTTGSNQIKNTNISEKNLINSLIYKSNKFFSNGGIVNELGINYKNSSKKGSNSAKYQDDYKSDNFLIAEHMLSYPLKNEKGNFTKYLTPKLFTMLSPFKSENLQNEDKQISIENLFSNNRLGLSDSLEGGKSLTIGFDFDIYTKNNDKIFSSQIGQIYKDKNDSKLPKSSTMHNKSSDILGQFNFSPNENFTFEQKFSLDNNFDTTNYNLTKAQMQVNNFITSFEFLEEQNDIGSDSYFTRDFRYEFSESNSLSFNTRRNRKRDLTEFYNLIYQYKNDCLVAAIEYNKNYYDDRDIKPNEEIYFSVTITPFASISSPSF
jgi:LPS-assembly protein